MTQRRVVDCAWCKNTGVEGGFTSQRQTPCKACGGSGKVDIPSNYVKCAFCSGTGAYAGLTASHKALKRCTTCNGLGWAAPKRI